MIQISYSFCTETPRVALACDYNQYLLVEPFDFYPDLLKDAKTGLKLNANIGALFPSWTVKATLFQFLWDFILKVTSMKTAHILCKYLYFCLAVSTNARRKKEIK